VGEHGRLTEIFGLTRNTSDVPRFSILMWPSKFELNQGVVIEGTMTNSALV